LFHRRRRESGKADDVTDRVDIGHGGATVAVYLDAMPAIDGDADHIESQVGSRAFASGRVHHRIGQDRLAAVEQSERAAAVWLDGGHRLTEAERNSKIAQILQGLHDFVVTELEHAIALFDDGDLRAERGEDRRVFDADDAGPDDYE
jgi:hypothetical protein